MGVVEERAFVVPFNVRAIDTLNGKIEFRQTPGGLVGFLTVNRNQVGGIQTYTVGFLFVVVLMGSDELFALHEHAAGTAAGVENPAFVGFQHFDQ